MLQDVPPDLRRKVARLVGTKCTLAARVDSFHQSTDGHVGLEYKEELEKKVDKVNSNGDCRLLFKTWEFLLQKKIKEFAMIKHFSKWGRDFKINFAKKKV